MLLSYSNFQHLSGNFLLPLALAHPIQLLDPEGEASLKAEEVTKKLEKWEPSRAA